MGQGREREKREIRKSGEKGEKKLKIKVFSNGRKGGKTKELNNEGERWRKIKEEGERISAKEQ
jgi:hypothetical protein